MRVLNNVSAYISYAMTQAHSTKDLCCAKLTRDSPLCMCTQTYAQTLQGLYAETKRNI